MKNTVFYLVRHGESLGNKNNRFLGHTDWDLSEKGYEQAYLTAKVLADVHFDYIYSSDLIRAYNTAVPHAKMRGMDIVTSKELREIYAGYWEGFSREEIIEKWGEEFTYKWRREFGTYTIPGGESVQGASDRFLNECKRIANMHPGKTILVTAHAAVIRSFWAKISKVDPVDYAEKVPFPSNASYSIAEFDGHEFLPISYSNDEHMGDLYTTVVYEK